MNSTRSNSPGNLPPPILPADDAPRMPFGRYRGRLVRDLPLSYLDWLWSAVGLEDPLRGWVRDEVWRRRAEGANI